MIAYRKGNWYLVENCREIILQIFSQLKVNYTLVSNYFAHFYIFVLKLQMLHIQLSNVSQINTSSI